MFVLTGRNKSYPSWVLSQNHVLQIKSTCTCTQAHSWICHVLWILLRVSDCMMEPPCTECAGQLITRLKVWHLARVKRMFTNSMPLEWSHSSELSSKRNRLTNCAILCYLKRRRIFKYYNAGIKVTICKNTQPWKKQILAPYASAGTTSHGRAQTWWWEASVTSNHTRLFQAGTREQTISLGCLLSVGERHVTRLYGKRPGRFWIRHTSTTSEL